MDIVRTTSKLTEQRIKEYLLEGKRFDGRGVDEFRDLIIETGISKFAEGSVRVKLGKTDVIVGVKMAVSEPYPDSSDEGNLMVSADLLPLSSSRFEAGPPKFPTIELGRVIDRGIRESKFIDFSKLCIKEGEKVWTVFVDIYSINDDGNLLDAAGIGAIIALKVAKIPEYDEETGQAVAGKFTGVGLPLSDNLPVSITAHKIGKSFIVDPNREEEDLSETRVTVGSSKGVIFSMQKGEEKSLEIEEVHKIFDLVKKVEKEIALKIKENLK